MPGNPHRDSRAINLSRDMTNHGIHTVDFQTLVVKGTRGMIPKTAAVSGLDLFRRAGLNMESRQKRSRTGASINLKWQGAFNQHTCWQQMRPAPPVALNSRAVAYRQSPEPMLEVDTLRIRHVQVSHPLLATLDPQILVAKSFPISGA